MLVAKHSNAQMFRHLNIYMEIMIRQEELEYWLHTPMTPMHRTNYEILCKLFIQIDDIGIV